LRRRRGERFRTEALRARRVEEAEGERFGEAVLSYGFVILGKMLRKGALTWCEHDNERRTRR